MRCSGYIAVLLMLEDASGCLSVPLPLQSHPEPVIDIWPRPFPRHAPYGRLRQENGLKRHVISSICIRQSSVFCPFVAERK